MLVEGILRYLALCLEPETAIWLRLKMTRVFHSYLESVFLLHLEQLQG